jgi:hypothetical protein
VQIATARHSKSWGDDDASSFLLQSTVKKAEQEVEKLRGDTYETNKKLQVCGTTLQAAMLYESTHINDSWCTYAVHGLSLT